MLWCSIQISSTELLLPVAEAHLPSRPTGGELLGHHVAISLRGVCRRKNSGQEWGQESRPCSPSWDARLRALGLCLRCLLQARRATSLVPRVLSVVLAGLWLQYTPCQEMALQTLPVISKVISMPMPQFVVVVEAVVTWGGRWAGQLCAPTRTCRHLRGWGSGEGGVAQPNPCIPLGSQRWAWPKGVICSPKSTPEPPGNASLSSVLQMGDAVAVSVCKLSFNLASCLPRGDSFIGGVRIYAVPAFNSHYSSSLLIPDPVSWAEKWKTNSAATSLPSHFCLLSFKTKNNDFKLRWISSQVSFVIISPVYLSWSEAVST